jgi:hypothetical protein
MTNFPGGNGARPGVYDEIDTVSTGTSVPGGTRVAALIGEGLRVERIVASAVGSGKDGLNSTYTSINRSDGRHFKLSNFPVISNRTVLFKNGIPLVGHEESIVGTSFSSRYDYRIEIDTGKIELQGASLVDQGGSFYSTNSLNAGTGNITSLTLQDVNAPTENWTVRCASVRRDGYGNPIDGYAKFIVQGNISGILLDGYGNQIVWQSNGTVVSNSILSFAINEGNTTFREGDKFTIKVKGGALTRGDSLIAHYIAVTDINDPEFFTNLDDINIKHGAASTTNRLSLGAQLAFANNPPGVWTCQAAPSVPRRISYILRDAASGNSSSDDLEFRLPLGVIPDTDSNINFFVTDPITNVEIQILPNKVDFYDSNFSTSPASFETGIAHRFSYTVILDPNYDTISQAGDGVITPLTSTTATFSSADYLFTVADAVNTRRIKILTPNANHGTFNIVSVTNGVATISRSSGTFTSSTSVEYEVLDTNTSGAVVLFTNDLALSAGQSLRATVVDVKDATFFDPGWVNAFQALEKIELSIVVPLPSQTISSIFSSARSHCDTMSNIKNRKERVLFIGAIQGLTPDNLIGNADAAVEDLGILEGIQGDTVTEILAGDIEDLTDYTVQNSFGNTFRVVYFYPDEIVVQIGANRVKVDGFFAAAAAAGFISGITNEAIPLTNKTLSGFTILRDKLFRPIIIENLINAGITLLEPVIGGGNVVWGRTTSNSGFPEEEEISVVFIRDRIAKGMRASFKGFIGAAESPTLQGSLQARANDILKSFIPSLITTFGDLKVIRDKVDPRQWNVTCRVQPVFPVNWIYIKIGLGVI